jgi:MoaE-MoaD fusion protein
MRVTLRLFAVLRQQAGWREREFELPEGASVEDAWQALLVVQPDLAGARNSVRFALNSAYASPEDTLTQGDQLAIIPPVAGGTADIGGSDDGSYFRCELTPEPIADEFLASLRRILPTPADGALVLFVGQARETPGTPAPGQEQEAARHAGQRVTRLDYEAFEEMALATLQAIAAEIGQRFEVRRLAMVHRVGLVAVGQPSVVIAAAAPHRGEAFEACRYAIEELKARAPIWKAEHYADGSVWIGAAAREGPLPSCD